MQRILVGLGLCVLSLALIALGYYTGPNTNVGRSRVVTINNTIVITTDAARPIFVIIDDDAGKQWVFSTMPNANSSSSISVSPSPTKCTVHIAMGGTLVDTSGPSPQPVWGTMTGSVTGSMAFSNSIDATDIDLDLSARSANITVNQDDDQLNVNLVYTTPLPAAGTAPAPPAKPAPPKPTKKSARPK